MRLLKRPTPAVLALLFVFAAVPAWAADFADGLLWKVERAGQAPSWIFGTFHSADPQILALPPVVTDAFAKAGSVSVEVVMTGVVPFRMSQAMQAPKGHGLDTTLPPELLDVVLGLAPKYSMPPDKVLKLKPWALMLLMGAPPTEHQRQRSGRFPLDMWLQQQALSTGKHLYGLETAEEQIEVFDGLPLQVQISLLKLSLGTSSEDGFGRMRALYLARDLAGLQAIWEETLAAVSPQTAAVFRDRLIDSRNQVMVKRMGARLAEGGSFIAIGALHLPGEKGVLRLLERKGYTITRLY